MIRGEEFYHRFEERKNFQPLKKKKKKKAYDSMGRNPKVIGLTLRTTKSYGKRKGQRKSGKGAARRSR